MSAAPPQLLCRCSPICAAFCPALRGLVLAPPQPLGCWGCRVAGARACLGVALGMHGHRGMLGRGRGDAGPLGAGPNSASVREACVEAGGGEATWRRCSSESTWSLCFVGAMGTRILMEYFLLGPTQPSSSPNQTPKKIVPTHLNPLRIIGVRFSLFFYFSSTPCEQNAEYILL